jgi:hypothetical protein
MVGFRAVETRSCLICKALIKKRNRVKSTTAHFLPLTCTHIQVQGTITRGDRENSSFDDIDNFKSFKSTSRQYYNINI